MSPLPVIAERRQRESEVVQHVGSYLAAWSVALLGFGVAVCCFNAANVLLLHRWGDPFLYLSDGCILWMAAIMIVFLRREPLPRVLLRRTRLWGCFLIFYGSAFFWSGLAPRRNIGDMSYVQWSLYAAGYSFAFLAVVSPPSGRRWNVHGVLDYAQAVTLAALTFQTSIVLSHSFDHLYFVAALQAYLALSSFLASRAVRSSAELRFTCFMAIHLVVAAALGVLSNAAEALNLRVWMTVGDALYPVDSLVALALACVVVTLPVKEIERKAHPVTMMPVLTTSAILLLCTPLLEARLKCGVIFLGIAFVIFSMRVSVLLTQKEIQARALLASNRELEQLALTDPLTGLANRRAFMQALRSALQVAATTGPAFSLVLIDLDDLKGINDSQGHNAGDLAIRDLATCMRQVLDLPFAHTVRLGGDEFAAILVGQTDPSCWLLGVRAAAAQNGITFSAGVASYGLSADLTAEMLIEIADSRLYEEKQAHGRSKRTMIGISTDTQPV